MFEFITILWIVIIIDGTTVLIVCGFVFNPKIRLFNGLRHFLALNYFKRGSEPQYVLVVEAEARWMSDTDLVIGGILLVIVTRCNATMVPYKRLVVVGVLEVTKRANLCKYCISPACLLQGAGYC